MDAPLRLTSLACRPRRPLSTPRCVRYRGVMDAIDFDTLDAEIDAERTQLAEALRRIADRLDSLAVEDVIEPLTALGGQAHGFVRRVNLVLRLPAM